MLNTLNAELNPIFHLLALLGAHPILHISRIRVNNSAQRSYKRILYGTLPNNAPENICALYMLSETRNGRR